VFVDYQNYLKSSSSQEVNLHSQKKTQRFFFLLNRIVTQHKLNVHFAKRISTRQ